MGSLKIREAYERSLEREGHVRDAGQQQIVEALDELQTAIESASGTRPGLFGWLYPGRRDGAAPVRGLYIWGGVGRGKTFLMDLFFDCLQIRKKKRIHFHRMMHDVHDRLSRNSDIEDPLDAVADDIAAETRVLCFDEFFVSDIGDAMILGRLLDGIFRRGVVLVATSNSEPDELYKDGLQRRQFLPAIELLKQQTDVIELRGATDYRLRLLRKSGTYLAPNDDAATMRLQYFFDESASTERREHADLDINGRLIRTRCYAKGIAWFDFPALCDGPRSQSDYIEISRWYPSVILSDVPVLGPNMEDQARRFIAVVDEFYDRHVKLIVSAEAAADALYTGTRLAFEFERTVSRLIEMQSPQYLALPHLA